MNTKEYEFHPYASVLPMLGTTEANELAADIQLNGLREDIVLFDGKILDGRNRYKACRTAGVAPRFRDFNGDGDPIDYIVSVNIRRRHLTASQKGLMVAKYAQLPRGNPALKSSKSPTKPKSVPGTELGKTAEQVAKEVHVSTSTVEQAKRVLRDAPKETIEEVERGEKSVKAAVREIKATKEQKEKHLDKTGYAIPDEVWPDWKEADSYRSLVNDQHKIKLTVEKALENRLLAFREISNGTLSTLTNAWGELQPLIPYAVCPTCNGRNREKCTACKQRGFVSEFGYKHWFPKKTIQMREASIKK